MFLAFLSTKEKLHKGYKTLKKQQENNDDRILLHEPVADQITTDAVQGKKLLTVILSGMHHLIFQLFFSRY